MDEESDAVTVKRVRLLQLTSCLLSERHMLMLAWAACRRSPQEVLLFYSRPVGGPSALALPLFHLIDFFRTLSVVLQQQKGHGCETALRLRPHNPAATLLGLLSHNDDSAPPSQPPKCQNVPLPARRGCLLSVERHDSV